MKRRTFLSAAPAVALVLALTAGSSRAEYFEYTSTVSAAGVTNISSVSGNNSTAVTLTTAGGTQIILRAQASDPGDPHIGGVPGSNIVMGSIEAITTADTPFENVAFDFSYTLTLTNYTDEIGGTNTGTGTAVVNGRLGGSVGSGRAVALNNLLVYAPPTQTVLVGGVAYTIDLFGEGVAGAFFTPPGADRAGTFGANISAIPEPGSVVAMGLGFIGLAGVAYRRHRARKAA